MAGWGRKAENKAKAQHSTDIIPSKLIAELQHSAWLGKTFPVGWVGCGGYVVGWLRRLCGGLVAEAMWWVGVVWRNGD